MPVRAVEAPTVPQAAKPDSPPARRATLDEAKDHLIADAQFLADRLAQTAEIAEYDLD
jgi:hypothetical protein